MASRKQKISAAAQYRRMMQNGNGRKRSKDDAYDSYKSILRAILMSNNQHEETQNQRLRDLEKRMTNLETQGSALLAKIDTLSQIGKVLILVAGTAIGIPVMEMM
jgi:uncharacterized protein YlxW (UPF0749 family)